MVQTMGSYLGYELHGTNHGILSRIQTTWYKPWDPTSDTNYMVQTMGSYLGYKLHGTNHEILSRIQTTWSKPWDPTSDTNYMVQTMGSYLGYKLHGTNHGILPHFNYSFIPVLYKLYDPIWHINYTMYLVKL